MPHPTNLPPAPPLVLPVLLSTSEIYGTGLDILEGIAQGLDAPGLKPPGILGPMIDIYPALKEYEEQGLTGQETIARAGIYIIEGAPVSFVTVKAAGACCAIGAPLGGLGCPIGAVVCGAAVSIGGNAITNELNETVVYPWLEDMFP